MKIARIVKIAAILLATVSGTRADTITLRNGDHLSGTIVTSEGKGLTLKTDYAGEIKIKWAAVKEVSSEQGIFAISRN